MKYEKITIEWQDASCSSDWTDLTTISDEIDYCVSTGYLIRQTENWTVLAATVDENTNRGVGIMYIPTKNIKKSKRKGEKKWKWKNYKK